MVTPAWLSAASDEIMKLYANLEEAIKTDMCRRLAKMGEISQTTRWQARILQETGRLTADINKYLISYDTKTRRKVKALFEALVKKGTGTLSPGQKQLMIATMGYQGLITDLANLTRTSTATAEFTTAATNLYMQTSSGAFSYQEALKTAVNDMASKGLHTISYGAREMNIEAAARMCVLTTLSQTAGQQSVANAEETGTDLVMVSAHEGARHSDHPQNPWSNHDEWQGKVYCLSGERTYIDEDGNERTAPDFYAVCGYGEVDGICGINCRHTFYPYYEGEATRYDNAELREYKAKDMSLDGKKVSRYDAEQEMRKAERQIREWKRRASCQTAAGIDDTDARRRLGIWQARRSDICKQTGLNPDYIREYIGTPEGEQPRGIRPTE